VTSASKAQSSQQSAMHNLQCVGPLPVLCIIVIRLLLLFSAAACSCGHSFLKLYPKITYSTYSAHTLIIIISINRQYRTPNPSPLPPSDRSALRFLSLRQATGYWLPTGPHPLHNVGAWAWAGVRRGRGGARGRERERGRGMR
jgi:hypothetical protein